jgi:hypothetical protein
VVYIPLLITSGSLFDYSLGSIPVNVEHWARPALAHMPHRPHIASPRATGRRTRLPLRPLAPPCALGRCADVTGDAQSRVESTHTPRTHAGPRTRRRPRSPAPRRARARAAPGSPFVKSAGCRFEGYAICYKAHFIHQNTQILITLRNYLLQSTLYRYQRYTVCHVTALMTRRARTDARTGAGGMWHIWGGGARRASGTTPRPSTTRLVYGSPPPLITRVCVRCTPGSSS